MNRIDDSKSNFYRFIPENHWFDEEYEPHMFDVTDYKREEIEPEVYGFYCTKIWVKERGRLLTNHEVFDMVTNYKLNLIEGGHTEDEANKKAGHFQDGVNTFFSEVYLNRTTIENVKEKASVD